VAGVYSQIVEIPDSEGQESIFPCDSSYRILRRNSESAHFRGYRRFFAAALWVEYHYGFDGYGDLFQKRRGGSQKYYVVTMNARGFDERRNPGSSRLCSLLKQNDTIGKEMRGGRDIDRLL
jgi:hypothetical protein